MGNSVLCLRAVLWISVLKGEFFSTYAKIKRDKCPFLHGWFISYCSLQSMRNFGAPAVGGALQSISEVTTELRITSVVVDAIGTLPWFPYWLVHRSPVSVNVPVMGRSGDPFDLHQKCVPTYVILCEMELFMDIEHIDY